MKQVGIIGYGRFGKILAKIVSTKYDVHIYDPHCECLDYTQLPIKEIVKLEMLFLAVPIREFENVIQEISNYKMYNTTIVDVCSVKTYPVEIMLKYLPKETGIIATHPMFGPDSYSQFRELKMVAYPVRDSHSRFDELISVFSDQSITIAELSPEKHDQLAAMSQGITHFIGRVLKEAGVSSTQINTLGFNDLLGVIEQTCNDSWDLFKDLQNYNPFTDDMVKKLEESIYQVRNQIGDQ